MFAYKFTQTTGTSSLGPFTTDDDVINISSKWHNDKNLTLKLDIADSSATGLLDVYLTGAESPTGNFTTFNMGSGTTFVITSGTSASGDNSDGVYMIPLYNVPHSGVTDRIKGIPYWKISSRSAGVTSTYAAWLIVG